MKQKRICENCSRKDWNGYIFTGNDEEYFVCKKCLDNGYKLEK